LTLFEISKMTATQLKASLNFGEKSRLELGDVLGRAGLKLNEA